MPVAWIHPKLGDKTCLFCNSPTKKVLYLNNGKWPKPIPKGRVLAACEKCLGLPAEQLAGEVFRYAAELSLCYKRLNELRKHPRKNAKAIKKLERVLP